MSQKELLNLKKEVLMKYNTFIMSYYNTCSRGPAASSFNEHSIEALYRLFDDENQKLPEEHRIVPVVKLQYTA